MCIKAFRLNTRILNCALSALFALSTLVSLRVHAQEVTASINGIVTDPSGSAVAGAKVTAKDMDRGTTWPTTTNDSGFYNFPRLPVGRYEVRAENAGFTAFTHLRNDNGVITRGEIRTLGTSD